MAEIGEFDGDDLEGLSAEEMQKQIEDLEAAIANAEDETAKSEAIQQQEPDMETMNRELERIDQEIERLAHEAEEDVGNVDGKSVYVGNVDYGSSAEELQRHFSSCGPIERATIQVNKLSGTPMGYAYVQFKSEVGASRALELNDSLFRGRQLKVSPKRVNVPNMGKGKGKGKGKAGKGSWNSGYKGGYKGRPRRYSKGYHPYSSWW
uniref:RRM domain-containing protein n=1 Tax=Eutreptiella gymnastica TaxID=73025 RepID=A0A7S1I9S3_9EUGL